MNRNSRTSNDPISDFLARIKNASLVSHDEVRSPYSNIVYSIAKILEKQGYVKSAEYIEENGAKKEIKIELKYYDGEPVIRGVERVSKPGKRFYVKSGEIPSSIGGLGLTILSTSKGVLTKKEAQKESVGGEVLCKIW